MFTKATFLSVAEEQRPRNYLTCCWIFRLIYAFSTPTTLLPLHFTLSLASPSPSLTPRPLSPPSLSHSSIYPSLSLLHLPLSLTSSSFSHFLSLTPPSCIINSHHLPTPILSIFSLFVSLILSFLYPSHSSISLPLSLSQLPNPKISIYNRRRPGNRYWSCSSKNARLLN